MYAILLETYQVLGESGERGLEIFLEIINLILISNYLFPIYLHYITKKMLLGCKKIYIINYNVFDLDHSSLSTSDLLSRNIWSVHFL